ncbi:MAG: ABC transporter substrate-binding protein [Acidimicrobiales bacterium]
MNAAVAIVVVGVVAAGCSSASSSGSNGGGSYQVTFASTTAFSGPSAFEGQVVGGVLKAAQAYLNSLGGILGHKVAVQYVDTKNDPADAVPATEKLLGTTSHIMMDVQLGTTDAPALAPIVNQAKIPIWASAGNSIYDQTHMKYFWRAVTPDAANGIAMALYIKNDLHLSRVATVFGTDSGSQGDLPGVLAGAKALGLNIVGQTNLTPAQPSYASQVAQVLGENPQVIVTEADPVTSATFWGEFTQQTSKDIPVIATAGTEGAGWTGVVSKDMGQARFTKEVRRVAIASPAPTPAGTLFAHWANTHSGDSQSIIKNYLLSSFGEYDWDGIMLAALAAVAAHSTSGAVFNSYIPQIADPGPGKTVVYSFAAGEKLLKEHKKIQYVGASGTFHFNRYHNSFTNQIAEYHSHGVWHTLLVIPQSVIAKYKVGNVA